MDHDKKIIWTAPEFIYYEKSVGWYWVSIIIAAILVLVAFWLKNLLFAVFIVIAEITLVFWARRYPKSIEFSLTEKELLIGANKKYPINSFDGFHVKLNENGFSELILRSKSKLTAYLKIMIFSKDAEEIKSLLQNHLEEIEYKESLSDTISNLLRF